jgi:hypothetical protein
VDLSAKCKKKQKTESDDIWELEQEMKSHKLIIDFEVEACGIITNASQRQNTCSRTLVLNEGMKDCPYSSRVGGSSKEEQGDYRCHSEYFEGGSVCYKS